MSSSFFQLCSQAASGNGEALHTVLRLLAGRTILVPVSVIIDDQDKRGTNRVKVVTLQEGSRRIVPIFSSEVFFKQWARDEYESLPLGGADLALTLPASTWVSVDPGQAHSLQLPPNEVEELAQVDALIETELDQSSAQETDVPVPPERTVSREELYSRLMTLFADYPDVLEAYFLENQGEPIGGILGLLTRALPVEDRFTLMSRIGEISRDSFGSTGAIEPYDDLNAPNAGTWELFKTLPPFYAKDENDSRSHYTSYLNAKVDEAVQEALDTPESPAGWATTVRGMFKRKVSS